jgi:hypothetical protein
MLLLACRFWQRQSGRDNPGELPTSTLDADRCGLWRRIGGFHRNLNADEVATGLGFCHGQILQAPKGRAFDGTMKDTLDPANFGQVDPRPVGSRLDLEALRIADGLLVELAPEGWISRPDR